MSSSSTVLICSVSIHKSLNKCLGVLVVSPMATQTVDREIKFRRAPYSFFFKCMCKIELRIYLEFEIEGKMLRKQFRSRYLIQWCE